MAKKKPSPPESGTAGNIDETDFQPVDVLPGVLVDCIAASGFNEPEDFNGIKWPPIVAVAPVVGDFVQAHGSNHIGRVEARGFRFDEVMGPVMVLHLSLMED